LFALATPLFDRLHRASEEMPKVVGDIAKIRALNRLLQQYSSKGFERCWPLQEPFRQLGVKFEGADKYPGIGLWELHERLVGDPDAVIEEL
jgi:hypothetical protein